jgi:DNA-binding GntR family transcriptional regulator
MSLTRSLIPQQHRPILDQLLVRLSLRQGQTAPRLAKAHRIIFNAIRDRDAETAET